MLPESGILFKEQEQTQHEEMLCKYWIASKYINP